MAYYDDFVYIRDSSEPHPATNGGDSTVAEEYFKNTKGNRQFTEGFIVDVLRKKHPAHLITVTIAYSCDLLGFANSRDDVQYFPHGDVDESLFERQFIPSSRRYGGSSAGGIAQNVVFGSFDYVFEGTNFLIYIIEGSDGIYKSKYNYILVDSVDDKVAGQRKIDKLLEAGSRWMQELHNEVLVFDNGYWQKNRELYDNVQKSNWKDVILDQERKDNIIDDVIGFFDAEKRYAEFEVPWKRGVIFYGPPGNGKTISTKALMHDISKRTLPSIESLYVKTFKNFQGAEYGVRQVFLKARQMAPCLLIFEDIDSLVDITVRSYFLNEVDGLESNHGILMIGSTNHLERLDPGIAKRPSRFDRKYLFDTPNRDERIQYCEYWRHKLSNNKKIDFPKVLSTKIADLTKDFSFAYMKEAFVAALLVIVRQSDELLARVRTDDSLSGNALYKELKKQIENLRKEMEGSDDEDDIRNMRGLFSDSNSHSHRKIHPKRRPFDFEYRPSNPERRPLAAPRLPFVHDRDSMFSFPEDSHGGRSHGATEDGESPERPEHRDDRERPYYIS